MRDPAALIALAPQAKTKIKATARGWSLVSRAEIEALAFVADLFLVDADLPSAPAAKPAPAVISDL